MVFLTYVPTSLFPIVCYDIEGSFSSCFHNLFHFLVSSLYFTFTSQQFFVWYSQHVSLFSSQSFATISSVLFLAISTSSSRPCIFSYLSPVLPLVFSTRVSTLLFTIISINFKLDPFSMKLFHLHLFLVTQPRPQTLPLPRPTIISIFFVSDMSHFFQFHNINSLVESSPLTFSLHIASFILSTILHHILLIP